MSKENQDYVGSDPHPIQIYAITEQWQKGAGAILANDVIRPNAETIKGVYYFEASDKGEVKDRPNNLQKAVDDFANSDRGEASKESFKAAVDASGAGFINPKPGSRVADQADGMKELNARFVDTATAAVENGIPFHVKGPQDINNFGENLAKTGEKSVVVAPYSITDRIAADANSQKSGKAGVTDLMPSAKTEGLSNTVGENYSKYYNGAEINKSTGEISSAKSTGTDGYKAPVFKHSSLSPDASPQILEGIPHGNRAVNKPDGTWTAPQGQDKPASQKTSSAESSAKPMEVSQNNTHQWDQGKVAAYLDEQKKNGGLTSRSDDTQSPGAAVAALSATEKSGASRGALA